MTDRSKQFTANNTPQLVCSQRKDQLAGIVSAHLFGKPLEPSCAPSGTCAIGVHKWNRGDSQTHYPSVEVIIISQGSCLLRQSYREVPHANWAELQQEYHSAHKPAERTRNFQQNVYLEMSVYLVREEGAYELHVLHLI